MSMYNRSKLAESPRKTILAGCLTVILLVLLGVAFYTGIIIVIWNFALTPLLGWKALSWTEAFGIAVLIYTVIAFIQGLK